MTVPNKAGHFLLHTTRRKSSLVVVLTLILLIIGYPFRSTLLPTAATSIANPTDLITTEPGTQSQSSEDAPSLPLSPSLSASALLARPISHDKTTIPKIIHQTWFPAGSNMSDSAQIWVATMKQHYSDWEYVLWDDESNEALVREHFPWFLETYKALPQEINRADMARNFYMFRFGGMYADVDTEALRPIDPLFASHEVSLASHLDTLSNPSSSGKFQRAFMGRMAHTLDPEGLGAIPNGWMASPPGHPFWLLPVLSVLENPKGDGSVEGMTGPGILGPLIKQYYTSASTGSDGGLLRQLCKRIRELKGGEEGDWSLFCPKGERDHSLEDYDHGSGMEGGGRAGGLGHTLILLPREQIYPFSWVDDGEVKVCLGAKSNPLFDPEGCKKKMRVDAWPSYFITYFGRPSRLWSKLSCLDLKTDIDMGTNLAPSKQSWNIVLCTLNWIFWSNLTILFNKWILESTPFKYPILLTTWHLVFATLATQLLAHTTPLLSARKSLRMNPRIYMAKIAPIGLLYSASLVCSNVAYVYLNVGFIQMLKAAGPVITLLTSYAWSVTELTTAKVVNILVIAVSVGVTVTGEIQFSWVGVGLQVVALVCDANRLVLMEIITSSSSSSTSSSKTKWEAALAEGRGREEGDEEEGKEKALDHHVEDDSNSQTHSSESPSENAGNLGKMDPLVSLYYTAPICFVMNAILAWKAEVQPLLLSQLQERATSSPAATPSTSLGLGEIILETGLTTLLANALVGFLLNVAVFTLVRFPPRPTQPSLATYLNDQLISCEQIGKTSGLTLTLVSIPKNILLIGASVVLWDTRVSLMQAVGYAVALGGLVVYSGGGGWVAEILGIKWLVVRGWRVYKGLRGGKRGAYMEIASKEEGERLV
ncbi:hypothetical protein BJX63DRAFT_432043 [Aspergillus granulosus]|uniref:Sugar phosphate transporter domain-containing protein n=1 Tax=Aspergillus granulosus TaxID=176169 RepID=A0ABR4HCL5_9EURO